MKIIITSNTSWNLFNFRKELIKELISAGYNVHVLAPKDKYSENLKKLGVTFHNIKLSRYNKTIIADFFYILKVFIKILIIRPNIIHNFTIKPVIYVGLASCFFKSILVINSITGLGISFSAKKSKSFLNKFILFLITISFNKKYKYIFQNPDDINFFIRKNILDLKQCYLIKGSGVVINNSFIKTPKSTNNVVFGIMSRMLWSKGVKDFIEAAKILNTKKLNIKFIVLGSPDINSPDSIPLSWLKNLNKIDNVFWSPHSDDIYNFLEKLDVFVLPSYYPEGLPKSLLEAASMQLPLISTDTPGCKEIVRDNVNGFLVEIKNPINLAEKMYNLYLNKDLRMQMGKKSFDIVKKEFSIDKVVNETFKVYSSI
tara:strand:+ start:6762 stop:7874 length:1113 start_codon:yes stop_codon:yes gene_type:complete